MVIDYMGYPIIATSRLISSRGILAEVAEKKRPGPHARTRGVADANRTGLERNLQRELNNAS